MLHRVVLCVVVELVAGVNVGECSDAETVRRVELLLKEVAAGASDIDEL